MKKKFYLYPQIETRTISVENGYSDSEASFDGQISDPSENSGVFTS